MMSSDLLSSAYSLPSRKPGESEAEWLERAHEESVREQLEDILYRTFVRDILTYDFETGEFSGHFNRRAQEKFGHPAPFSMEEALELVRGINF